MVPSWPITFSDRYLIGREIWSRSWCQTCNWILNDSCRWRLAWWALERWCRCGASLDCPRKTFDRCNRSLWRVSILRCTAPPPRSASTSTVSRNKIWWSSPDIPPWVWSLATRSSRRRFRRPTSERVEFLDQTGWRRKRGGREKEI